MNLQLLTEKLLNALNENYDVTHMDTVISVIAALEISEITKEQLESTRLAKYINEFRKKTTSENLARRSKNLLKKWREMICLRQPVDFADSNSNSNFPQLKKKRRKKSPSPSPCAVSDDLSLSNSSLSAPTVAPNEKTELTFSGRFAAASSQSKNEGEQPPKKRGRKKGSRGVDAIITKNSIDQLLKTSKLLSVATGGQKKIKTTQELLADIQGRKCIEPPENSTSSASSVSCTPENSNQLLPNGNSPEFRPDFFQPSPIREIETELEAIRAQLPPHSISMLNENFPTVPCTCFIKEVENSKQEDTIMTKEETEEWNNDINSATKSQKSFSLIASKLSMKREAVKKSIFDFDYEEGNDPLDDILREVKKETVNDDSIEAVNLPVMKLPESLPLKTQDSTMVTKSTEYKTNLPNQLKKKLFEIIENENCPAKNFFVLRVGKIGKTQIQSLHNSNIKNVNGNIVENETNCYYKSDRIVPQYNHISFEWIPKDLSHWNIGCKLKKKWKFSDDVFLGCVNKDVQCNNNSVKTKKNKKKRRMKPPPSQKELRRIKIVNGGQNGFHISDVSDTPESSPPELFTDDSSSSFSEFHQVTSSSNSAAPNRIVLTIKKTTNKKRSRENKENLFVGKKIKINGFSTDKATMKPLQVQRKDLIARILSLSDDFYLETKFPVLRCSCDETTKIFMAHELSPLPKLIKISEDIAVESAPAPASSSSTDDSDTGSDTDESENNLSDGSTEETETSSNIDLFSNEDVEPNSVILPETFAVPEIVQNDNFREWYETLQVRSYNDELLTILPYVIFD